jgi:hypothetical protein
MTTKQKTAALAKEVQTRILALLTRKNGTWNGSMTELNQAITTGIRRAVPTTWPGSPSILRRIVNKALYSLRKAGVKVQFGRTPDHMRKRFVNFSKA